MEKAPSCYLRSDFDGRKWWTTWLHCQEEKPEMELTLFKPYPLVHADDVSVVYRNDIWAERGQSALWNRAFLQLATVDYQGV